MTTSSSSPASHAADFFGAWRLAASDNFDAYLKALGIGAVLRRLAALATPTLRISVDQDGLWTMRTETFVKSCNTHFRLNEPFSETTIDDRRVEAIITLEEVEEEETEARSADPDRRRRRRVKLVHLQTDSAGRRTRIERAVGRDDSGGDVIMRCRMTVADVVSTAVFRKISS